MLHKLTYLSLHIDLLKSGKKSGDASGFLIERKGQYYLCTNKHVLLGSYLLHLEAPILKSPDQCDIWFYNKSPQGIYWSGLRATLHDGAGNKTWLVHTSEPRYDIALVHIPYLKELFYFHVKLDLPSLNRFSFPGKKVCILGFPFGVANGPNAPIWKTGHLAADMNINWNGDPCFVIDCETSVGMSGSPVFDIDESLTGHESGYQPKFLGLYSGRVRVKINKRVMYPRLARVWKAEAIEETFRSNGL